jgi:small subunit ribosomal protein S16
LAVKLRLRRMGKKRQPIYKVVAADVRSPRDGKFIEAIGLYNPTTDPATIEINEQKALYWLGTGARPTDTVKNILSDEGILLKRQLIKEGSSEEEIAVKMEEWRKQKEAKLSEAAKKKEKKKQEAEKKAKTKVEEETKSAEPETKSMDDNSEQKERGS